MLKLRKIKPIGSQVLVTKSLYGWDDKNEVGLILNKKGSIKTYQEVISIGDNVTFVKPGDIVEINYYRFAEFEKSMNSVQSIEGSNTAVNLRLDEVEMEGVDGEPVTCFLIDQRDVKYILEDYDEVTYEKKKEVIITPPKNKLILPDSRIKV